MSKDLLRQLKSLKNDARAGAASDIERLNARSTLLQAIGYESLEREKNPPQPLYVRWAFFELISAPVPVAVAVLFIGLGGWFTSVNAASSLPGDRLYSVKLATEKAQLTLSSLEHKAVLHTEFAERRLGEATALHASDRPDKEKYYSETLQAFKAEVSRAGEGVRTLTGGGDPDALAVATEVDKKIVSLNETLRGQITGPQINTEAAQVQDETREISHAVEDVIVEKKQETSSDSDRVDLEDRVKRSINNINQRQAYLLGRITVLEKALAAQKTLPIILDDTLRYRSERVTEAIPRAMDLMASGGYKDALAILRESEKALSTIELEVAELEVAVTTAMSERASEGKNSESVKEEEI